MANLALLNSGMLQLRAKEFLMQACPPMKRRNVNNYQDYEEQKVYKIIFA